MDIEKVVKGLPYKIKAYRIVNNKTKKLTHEFRATHRLKFHDCRIELVVVLGNDYDIIKQYNTIDPVKLNVLTRAVVLQKFTNLLKKALSVP